MNTGRRTLSAEVADSIRELLADGQVGPGAYLPPERELVRRFGVSRVTVRRALGQLVSEGRLETVPHQGYRPVTPQATNEAEGPVAYVLAQAEPDQAWDLTHEQIVTALNRRLMQTGRHTLAVGTKGRGARDVFAELAERGVRGVVLDTSLSEYVDAAAASRLPFLIVDAHTQRTDVDIVIQDNFGGARSAAGYLLARGHRSIGWVGPMRGMAHYRERFAGARSALVDAGIDFAPGALAETSSDTSAAEAVDGVRGMLASKKRPTAIVCMWRGIALAAQTAVGEAGLTVGRDVELAAWATEREYREVLAPQFLGGMVPATAVWSPDEMAELALDRLERRAAGTAGPACRIDVRVRLLEPRAAEDVVRNGVAARPAGAQ